MNYVITNDSEGTHVQLFFNGQTHFFSGSGGKLDELITALISGADEETIEDILRLNDTLDRFLERLTERVSYSPATETVYFDGDPVDNVIANAIIERYNRGFDDIEPILNFYEKLMQNPSADSRRELYSYLNKHGLTLTENGNFLAYKGLRSDFTSINAGKGIVNGEFIASGHLDNTPGNVVEFPRSEVDDNRDNTCSVGLHGGSYGYARDFAQGRLVLVEINPRDVVSVPSDHNEAKLRTCRYVVRQEVSARLESQFYTDDIEPEVEATDELRQAFIEELVDATVNYTDKGRVADTYVDMAVALGYTAIDPQYYYAQVFDNAHTAQAVYRYHVLRLS